MWCLGVILNPGVEGMGGGFFGSKFETGEELRISGDGGRGVLEG